jgi:hypothetical protein
MRLGTGCGGIGPLLHSACCQASEGLTPRDAEQVLLQGAPIGLIAIELTQKYQKHLLNDVLGGSAAADVHRVTEYGRPVPFEEPGKGTLIASSRPLEQPEIVHSESIASQTGKSSLFLVPNS